MSPKAKILSDLEGEIKYLNCAAGANFFEQNCSQSGFSFRKIVFGRRFREDFSEKNPTWEVCILQNFRACGQRKTTFPNAIGNYLKANQKVCSKTSAAHLINTLSPRKAQTHRQKSSETDRGDHAARTSRATKESAAKLKPGMQTLVPYSS